MFPIFPPIFSPSSLSPLQHRHHLHRRTVFVQFTPPKHLFFLLLYSLFCSVVPGISGVHNAQQRVVTESEEFQFTNINTKCEKIRVEMCSDIQYNMTIYPNLLKHAKQEEAEMDIKQYEMLVKVQCSADFKFFLCTLFTPVCTILNEPIPPCRHLCLSAKNGCEALMRKFGYQWPDIFNCDKMPESRDGMCVGENKQEQDASRGSSAEDGDGDEEGVGSPGARAKKMLECPHTMKVLSKKSHSLLIANQSIEQCSLPCQNDGLVPTFFNANIRHYLRLWTGAWAVACCVCCAFTMITFLIDLERFEYPEKAILYMAICYLMVSATYMVGLFAEDSLSCSVFSATKQQLVTQGNENAVCSLVAVVHYFFSTAGILWWLILCFSWFLVTTLKWGEAPVGQVFSTYFNLLAWLLPTFGAVALVLLDVVDGDLFTGICSLGNLRSETFLHLVIYPQFAVIGLGLLLFGCGFISILRIRSYIKEHRFIANKFEQTDASEKLSKLMFRIGCFSMLYVIPMGVGIVCAYYQAKNMDIWLTNWYSTRCLHAQRAAFGFTAPREQCPIGQGVQQQQQQHPEPMLFFLKYLSHFSAGIACVVWTLNGKTVQSYADCFSRVCLGGVGNDHRARGRPSRVPTRPT